MLEIPFGLAASNLPVGPPQNREVKIFLAAKINTFHFDVSARASNSTPASDVIAPPSKAAVIFLPDMAGKDRKSEAGSVMATWQFLSDAQDGFNTTI